MEQLLQRINAAATAEPRLHRNTFRKLSIEKVFPGKVCMVRNAEITEYNFRKFKFKDYFGKFLLYSTPFGRKLDSNI